MSDTSPLSAIRAIVTLYREFEREGRHGDLSIAQYRLMLYLRDGPKRAGQVAAAIEIAKPTASLVLNALRDRGWIENVADTDGRATTVVMTADGWARMHAFEARLSDILSELLDAPALEALSGLMGEVYEQLGRSKDRRLGGLEKNLT